MKIAITSEDTTYTKEFFNLLVEFHPLLDEYDLFQLSNYGEDVNYLSLCLSCRVKEIYQRKKYVEKHKMIVVDVIMDYNSYMTVRATKDWVLLRKWFAYYIYKVPSIIAKIKNKPLFDNNRFEKDFYNFMESNYYNFNEVLFIETLLINRDAIPNFEMNAANMNVWLDKNPGTLFPTE